MRSLGLAAAVVGILVARARRALAFTNPTTASPAPAKSAVALAAPGLGVPSDLPALAPAARIDDVKKPAAPVAKAAAAAPAPVPPPEPEPRAEPLPVPPGSEGTSAKILEQPKADPEQIVRNTLRLSLSAFEDCYQNSLRRDSRIKGRVVVTVGVAATGHVSSARIEETTIKDDGVINCITTRLKALRFPPLGEEVEVTLPLSLVPREG
jgi:outer membrane biosynthesis protein TonB